MARQDVTDAKLKHCIMCDRWTKEYKLKQHYCDPCWRVYRRQQNRIAKHRATLMEFYGNRCAICERDLTVLRSSTIHVDHDHSAAYNIRGILCLNCNSILGHARDKRHILEAAIKYLEVRQDRPLEEVLEEIAAAENPMDDLFIT